MRDIERLLFCRENGKIMTVSNLMLPRSENPQRSGYFFVRELTMEEWPMYLFLHEAREEHERLKNEIYLVFYEEFKRRGCSAEVESDCQKKVLMMERARENMQKIVLQLMIALRIWNRPIVLKGEWKDTQK